MNRKMTCTLYYNKKTATQHLKQIFTGFYELKKRGFIDIKIQHNDWLPESYTENLLMVILDNKHKIIYDVNDGFNWLWANTAENLQFFRETLSVQAEYYFKRSYNDELLAYNPGDCKLYPLGLNYPSISRENKVDKIQFDFKSWVKYQLKGNEWLARKFKAESRKQYDISNFEYPPVSQNKEPKILFLTRLWDPGTLQKDKLTDTELYETNIRELHEINTARAQSIIECKKLFGKQFTGGLFRDSYSVEKYPELVVPDQVSSKESYLKTVKQSDICIATTGLHKSIGWKMGEYVAAARGIITEKIHFDLPGNFSSPANYLEFNDVQQLLGNVTLLLENPDMLRDMMFNNYNYYNLYVRPDNLVLNTLLTVKAHADA